MANLVQDLIDQVVIGAKARILDDLQKADTFSAGVNGQQLVWYDLDESVKYLYPFEEQIPLVAGNAKKGIPALPRVPARGGNATHWKTVTAINATNISGGVARGQRGGKIAVDTNDMSAAFKSLGLEASIDFETRYEEGELAPDNISTAVQSALRSVLIYEEKCTIFGNTSLALGTTPTPVLTASASGGSLATQTLSVIAVALTGEGYYGSSIAAGVPGQISRINADGTTATYGGGSAKASASQTVSVTGPTGSAAATVARVSGAFAYAWYWGTAGNETLGAITTINSAQITAAATGTQPASAVSSDNSQNPLVFDGILSQMTGQSFGAASRSYVGVLPTGTAGTGTGLTTDNNGGIEEFDELLKDRWDKYKLGFDRILCNSQEAININRKALNGSASGATSLFRFQLEADKSEGVVAGSRVIAYHNKFTGRDLDVVVHPWVPPGTIVFWSDRVPYALSNVSNILQFKVRQGYYQIQWPLATRQYQYGVYVDEVLQNCFTPAFGMITNIGNA
jgi:hypothetical protein